MGQQVTAGQSLGTLDTTSLSESVSSAQSTLNSDEAKLAQDETSQSASTSSTPSASPTATTTTTRRPRRADPSTGTQSTITQDQNTLTQDEAKTGADQQQEAADLAQAQQACGTGTTTTTSSTTTTTNPANCEAALAQVSKDQQQVSADQAAVAKDEAALSQALSQGSSSTQRLPHPDAQGALVDAQRLHRELRQRNGQLAAAPAARAAAWFLGFDGHAPADCSRPGRHRHGAGRT